MTRAIPFGDGLKDIKGSLEKQTNRTLPFGGKWSVDKMKINRRKREFNQEKRETTDETKSKKDVKPLYVEVRMTLLVEDRLPEQLFGFLIFMIILVSTFHEVIECWVL